MSGYKSFAVAGAGNLGAYIINALIDKKEKGVISSITILTRSTDGHDEFVAKGVKVVAVDYSSPPSVQSALSGVDVLISTLGESAFGSQDALASSAKAAGVQLFVPSEFGNPSDNATKEPWIQKEAMRKKLKNEVNLPYASFYTGPFPDQIFEREFCQILGLGFNLLDGKVSIPGSGTAAISFTTRPDIAQFVAHVLTALPKDQLEWRTFRIEGDRISYNQLVETWKARTGKDVTVSHRPRKELEDALEKNPADHATSLLLSWDGGKGVVGKPEEVTNAVFPGWKPKKVIDVLLELYEQ